MSHRIVVPNMNFKYFHVVELLHNSFVAMVTVVIISNQVNQQHILSQGTYVPNTDLRYSHKAELLHSLLVTMVTVFSWQKDYLVICIASKNLCIKYEVEILSCS